jgi:hypothetical protein
MKITPLRLSVGVLLLAVSTWYAQDAPKAGMEGRLAQALKLFPEADTDKDGTLSVNEALAYLESHPELKEKLFKKAGGSKSSSSSRTKPASFAPGAEGTKVFVCAHSFMIYTADTLPVVSKSAQLPYLNAGQQMIGGSRVIQHWDLPDDQNQAKKALREGIVDVLLLSPHALLPDAGIDHFTRLGLEKNPNLRVLVQSSWAPRDGKETAFNNAMRDAVTAEEARQMRVLHQENWLKQMEAQVNALNTAVGKQAVCIVPVSDAVYALRERIAEGKVPSIAKQSELFRDDLGHPTAPIMLLATYCHFAAIHGKSPIGLPVPASLKEFPQATELNQLLQQLAWEAVTQYPMSGVKIEAK